MKINIALILLLSINGIRCLSNGRPVKPGYSNFVTTVWEYESTPPRYLCSGSIISESHVITAGHCVHDFGGYQIYVTAGRIDLGDMLSLIVKNVYVHYNFRKVYNPSKPLTEYWLNDIAVLKLIYQIAWRPNIQPVLLDRRRWTLATCNECYIMGWSYTSTNTTLAMTFQWAPAAILGVESLRQISTFLLQNEIYAFLTASHATVDDTDIGNSLMCPDAATGIIIGGRNRSPSVVTVLTLAPYMNFIDYIIYGGVAEIEEGEFRDVISIWKSGYFRCGGFMVDYYHIVTAAQCMSDMETVDLRVIAAHPSEQSSVENITVENDIAVLKLTSALPWNPSIHWIDLPDLSEISSNSPCQILRWTHSTLKNTTSKMLMKSPVRIFDSEENEESDFHLGAEQFRVKSFHSFVIATDDDIGNPIVCENNIIGMVFAVNLYALATTAPVTCLKILPYQSFIRSVINKT